MKGKLECHITSCHDLWMNLGLYKSYPGTLLVARATNFKFMSSSLTHDTRVLAIRPLFFTLTVKISEPLHKIVS